MQQCNNQSNICSRSIEEATQLHNGHNRILPPENDGLSYMDIVAKAIDMIFFAYQVYIRIEHTKQIYQITHTITQMDGSEADMLVICMTYEIEAGENYTSSAQWAKVVYLSAICTH